MLSRREFLRRASMLSLSPVLPCFLSDTAQAAPAEPDARVLVVIQLDGGNDGINTVVPFGDDGYGRARKKLRLDPGDLHRLGDHVGLHPSMRAAKELFDDGRLAIVQGVGYPNPSRSHFRSMRIWQTARLDDDAHDDNGWLGRALDQRLPNAKSDHSAGSVFVGEEEIPVALWGRRSGATALSRADDLRLASGLASDPSSFTSAPRSGALERFVTSRVLSAYASADQFERQRTGAGRVEAVSYPDTQLGARLKLVSELLRSRSQARIFYTIQGGYDTHSAQLYTHARLLQEFSGALKAFLGDLKGAKLDDRVVVLAFSEFGRRVRENDSQGTDHGTAGPVFLAGSAVQGGLLGRSPDLTDLDGGDLKMQIDFRQVYATLLDDWLGVDPENVLDESRDKLPLLSSVPCPG
jgi:uncharacterized protein (DUF1501 family)